eukprot:341752-Prorocentrum_minimum.AAC.1
MRLTPAVYNYCVRRVTRERRRAAPARRPARQGSPRYPCTAWAAASRKSKRAAPPPARPPRCALHAPSLPNVPYQSNFEYEYHFKHLVGPSRKPAFSDTNTPEVDTPNVRRYPPLNDTRACET